jgi:hypothetical protein
MKYIPAKKYPCIDCSHVSARKNKRCAICSEKARAERERLRREAERAARAAESQTVCVDCGVPVRGNAKRCSECRKPHELARKKEQAKGRWQRDKARAAALAEVAKEEHIRPHRAKKVVKESTMTEAEREAADAKQRLIDLQLRARDDQDTAARLGLKYQPGKPLASTVRHLSRSEIARIAATMAPPQRQKELPHYVM